MRDIYEGSHLEMGFRESEFALSECAWIKWANQVERLLGHSLDGENSQEAIDAGTNDGYSMDEAFAAFNRGDSARLHASEVEAAKAALKAARS